jgi:hypothetical protein
VLLLGRSNLAVVAFCVLSGDGGKAMSNKNHTDQQQAARRSSAGAALMFLLVGFGGFYGLITAVDPLL